MTRGMPVTLADVARRAGVSLATASRVVNGSSRQVTADLRERVLAAAGELGYTPNAQAQALARNATNVVGLVVHDITDAYFSSIAAGVIRVADERELIVMLGSTFRDPQREVDYAAMLRAQRVRAIIIAGTRTSDRAMTRRVAVELEAFRQAGGGAACVSQRRLPADTVAPENRAGARQLARRLVALGHRRFAVLTGPVSLLTARERLTGFREGLAEAGLTLPPEAIVEGAFTRDGGHAAALELLAREQDVSCVFAVNDVMAVGAVAALRERAVGVPDAISVAGFDDIAPLRDLSPSLTTVRLPLEDMGARAAAMALDPDPERPPRVVRVPGEVVVRASTRRVE